MSLSFDERSSMHSPMTAPLLHGRAFTDSCSLLRIGPGLCPHRGPGSNFRSSIKTFAPPIYMYPRRAWNCLATHFFLSFNGRRVAKCYATDEMRSATLFFYSMRGFLRRARPVWWLGIIFRASVRNHERWRSKRVPLLPLDSRLRVGLFLSDPT
jgi:hypothetical protein